MARFLADENFPGPSVRLLRDAGHDVASVKEAAPRTADPDVLRWAARERRVLLTLDADYGDLVFRHGLPAPWGVVFCRLDPVVNEEPALRILALLEEYDAKLEGMFTTIKPRSIRQRPLG